MAQLFHRAQTNSMSAPYFRPLPASNLGAKSTREARPVRFATAAVVLLLAGCASSNPEPVEVATAPAVAPPPPPVYELTAEEKKLDCRRLTGRIKVRIAAMRSQAGSPKPSAAAATAQTVAAPVFGGTTRSVDPAADARADRAKLDAYNKRLVELKCPTVDIDGELAGKTPAVTSKATSRPAPKPAAAPKPTTTKPATG